MKVPSRRRQAFFWRTTTAKRTFFLNSGLPFLTEAKIMSPGPAFGRRFKREPIPLPAIMYKFLAPELSAQLIKAATLRPKVIFSLAPRPVAPPFILIEFGVLN